jgi:hypothetical protein
VEILPLSSSSVAPQSSAVLPVVLPANILQADEVDWAAWLSGSGIGMDEAPELPEHFDVEPDDDSSIPALTLAEWLDAEGERYRRMGHGAGDLVSRSLSALADTVRLLKANTPEQYEGRLMVMASELASREFPEPEPELLPSGRWA